MTRPQNHRLREAIERSGYTYEALAAAVRTVAAESGVRLNTNRSAVSHWANGARPREDTAIFIAESLSRRLGGTVRPEDLALTAGTDAEQTSLGALDGDPVAQLANIGRMDMERRRLIAATGYSVAVAALPLTVLDKPPAHASAHSNMKVGATDIAAVHEVTQKFTDLDERRGGQHGSQAAAAYFTEEVLPLARGRFASTDLEKQMRLAAASMVNLLAWKAYDAGRNRLAQDYYLQSLRLTREAGSDTHTAFVLRGMAQHAINVDQPQHSLALSERALRMAAGKVDPSARSLFHIAHARALARDGQAKAAVREAVRAGNLAETSDADDRMPNWSALWSPPVATVANNTAKFLVDIGDYLSAENFFRRAASTRPDASYLRINGLTLLAQGEIQARTGRLDEACHTWSGGLDRLRQVRSARATKAVADIRVILSPYRRRSIPAVNALDRKARNWLTAGA